MAMDMVSVIMPVYNSGRFIEDSILSVISQTYSCWELIVVDDGSTDNSKDIVEQYVKKDSRIHLLQNYKPLGIPAIPRNIGIQQAKGRFIAFLDSDDIWFPTKLEQQVRLFNHKKTAIVFSNYEKMNEEGVEGLLAWWDAQPRRRRNDLELKTALIQRLIDCNDHESAYEFTLEIMKKLGDNTPISPELCTQITRLQAEDNSKLLKLVEKRAKRADESQRCCLNRALGYLYVRNNDFAKAAEAFKEVTACPTQLQPNDVMMASYVFEQAGDKAAAEKIRQDSLKSAMSIQDKPAEIQTEAKTDEEPTALIAKRD